jgi:hypothetical protein
MHAHRNIAALLATGAVMLPLFAFPAHAGDVIYGDFAEPYQQRSDTIFPGAGDAKSANSAIHVIDPWPRHSANPRIPANGERMVGAVERYRDVRKLPQAPQPIAPVAIDTSGFSSSGAGSAASSGK